MDQGVLTLTLGREELFLLLHIFHVTALPGLEEDPLLGMSEEQAAAAFVSAERSLRARGLIRILEEEQRIEVDPVVMALVGSCLRPEFSLLVSSQTQAGEPGTRYYHIAAHLTVEHASPETGVHHFTGVGEPEEMLPRVMAFLDLSHQVALQCPASRVRESVLIQVRDRVQGGEAEVAQGLLHKDGVADITAEGLIETLAQPVSNASVARVDYSKAEDEQVQGFSILAGSNALWILTPEEGEEDELWVNVESTSVDIVKDSIKTLLEA